MRFRLPLVALCALSLAACDTTGPEEPGPGPGPEPDPVTVTFDWSDDIHILADCEVAGSGDFRFRVDIASDIDGARATENLLDRDVAANSGQIAIVNDGDPTTFTVPSGASASFSVSFFAEERDATSSNDLGQTETTEHTLSGRGISPSGNQRILLEDGSNCRVELRYSVTAS